MWAGRAWGSSPGEGKRYFFSKSPYRFWGPSSLIFNGYRPYFLGVRRPESEVNQSHPSIAVVKNEWRYTSIPPLGHHVVLYGEVFYGVFLVTY